MKIREISDVLNGYAFKSSNYISDGYRVIRITNVQSGYIEDEKPVYYEYDNKLEKYELQENDLLISLTGNVGRCALVTKEFLPAYLNQRVCCLRVNKEKVMPKFLYYILNSKKFEFDCINSSQGIAQLNMSTEWLKEYNIEIPTIELQKKVINVFDKVYSNIDIKKKQISSCNNLIKSQFVEMLYLNPSANKLGEFISRYKVERANDIDYPVLSITKEFGIVLQSEKFKKRIASDDTSSYKVVPYGKLVQGIHIDERNFAIQNKVDNGIVSPAYKIWNVDETKCNSEVLAYALRSDYVMNYIRSKFTGSIKRRENINYEDFMATPINLPKLEIQNEFYEKKKLIDKQKFVNLKIFQLLGKK